MRKTPSREAILDYYAEAGPTTELAEYAELVGELPSDPEELARITRGLVIHEGVVAQRRLQLPPERFADRKRVGAASIVQRILGLDDSPLSSERAPERRMVGFCYHFAILHCALLRAKGWPSRARCGFAAYYRDDAWIDHWVVEYWKRDRWVVIDPDSGRNVVSPTEFHHAGLAWQLCRGGGEDPSAHGNHVLWGWDELRGSLISDVGALNKVEVAEWESWCDRIAIENKDQPSPELDAHLDDLADLVSREDAFEELQRSFRQDEGLRPPAAMA